MESPSQASGFLLPSDETRMSLSERHYEAPGTPGVSLGLGVPPRRHRPPRRFVLLALLILVLTAVVILVSLVVTYQPLGFGGESDVLGGRIVNTFGASSGNLYYPPQRGTFTITESIQNRRPEAVTIEAVAMQRPPAVSTTIFWPLAPAGRVLYRHEYLKIGDNLSERPIRGLSLAPQQAVVVAIPVRMADACYEQQGWEAITVFYVEERLLTFTHWVAIRLGVPITMHEPEPRGTPGIACPS